MTPWHHGGSAVRLSDAELESLLARAAEEGPRRALSDVGLGAKGAVLTIHDMQSVFWMPMVAVSLKAELIPLPGAGCCDRSARA